MFTTVFVAGTFDHLHAGHVVLLQRAFAEGERVIVGLTTDEFVKKFKNQTGDSVISPFDTRKAALSDWLTGRGYSERATILPINDPHEPATSENWDAIVVSAETAPRATIINEIRKAHGLKPLAIVVVPMVNAEPGGAVSSTRIRSGDIDAAGRRIMPEELRELLAKPIGEIKRGSDIRSSFLAHKNDIVITVGDVTTSTYLGTGNFPSLAIVDLKVNRQQIKSLEDYKFGEGIVTQRIQSGPGYIAEKAIDAITSWSKNGGKVPMNIVIDGEEDLLVLPVVLLAPIRSVVYYGQPNQGVVEVLVSQDKKARAQELLAKFQ